MTHNIPDTPYGKVWLTFSSDTPLEEAYIRFRERYGYNPKQHYYDPPGLLFVGPVNDAEKRNNS